MRRDVRRTVNHVEGVTATMRSRVTVEHQLGGLLLKRSGFFDRWRNLSIHE
jgi:hypothetical protein